MTQLIGMIADDLTGANDSGVQLAEKGIHTSVLFDIPNRLQNLDAGVVIDTNSRALSREAAMRETKKAGLFLKQAGYKHIYKKMDSTLRGHIGSELQALAGVFNPDFVFIAPAFPSMGRTTTNGVHYVHGVQISNTEISRDPKHPVKESSIPNIIERETGQRVGLITTTDLESRPRLNEKLADFVKSGVTYIVSDAESQAHLQLATRAILNFSERIIWAGSAGLAEVLPEELQLETTDTPRDFSQSGQVLTVCGSLSEVTQSQVAFAMKQEGITNVEIDTVQIFGPDWPRVRHDIISSCLQGLEQGDDLVLYVPSHDKVREEVKSIGQRLGLNGYEIGEGISSAIGEVVAEVVKAHEALTALILTGGDTAKESSRFLGGIGFRLIKQIEAGIPLGTLIGTPRELTIVTKAGAFGKEDSIYKAMQELKGVRV
ncbi:four-carbon acid sugar kinase family protein [Caldalkalibacillus salinus]|uniref:four-carbon acid sugar kinase family protein n=1 Tax=Caldalkalibacillus salinus TaxID=2803787 RepID=UPI001923FCAF|nr:four-carbon acid sugar kinase family protein [Caldalkalibacillus salinus]